MTEGLEEPPDVYEQAKAAARDDPTRTQLANMLLDLPAVSHAHVYNEDEDTLPTSILVLFADEHGRGTGEVLTIMRRAGWEPTHVTFSRERISFEERGER